MFTRFQKLLPHHLDKEIAEIYTAVAIKKFAFRMITVFEPIYLFLFFSESPSKVLFYYGSVSIIFGLLSPLGARVMTRIGLKKTIIASFPFAFSYYIFLLNIDKVSGFFLAAIIASALYKTFFWPAFHIEFTKFSEGEERGREFSLYRGIISIVSALSPIAGGFLISQFGFPVVFIVVLVLLAAAALPLLFTPDNYEHYTDSYEKAFLRILRPKRWGQVFAFLAKGAEAGIQIIIWPILLYTLAINYSSLGAITTASFAVSIFAGLLVGKMLDSKTKKRKMLKISSWILALVHLSKAFVYNIWSAFGIDIAHKLSGNTGTHISYRTIFYDEASKHEEQADEFIIFREIVTNVGRGIVLFGVGIMFFFVPSSITLLGFSFSYLYLAFVIAAGFSLLLPFI